MDQDPEDAGTFAQSPELRWLRRLVTGLLVVLILATLAIAGTIVIRLGLLVEGPDLTAPRAEAFVLPEGHEIVAVGRGPGEALFVLRAPDGTERLHVFDAAGGALRHTAVIRREP